MGGQASALTGPDLALGISETELFEGRPLLGHAHGEAVVMVRHGGAFFAIGASCTHYGGPLAEGLVVGETLRCPWHHAAFSLKTGEAVRAPALNPVAAWKVERDGGKVKVTTKITPPSPSAPAQAPESVVIVGGGAAGQLAAETLRREGYAGKVVMVGREESGPVDRPNLSKDYLAGNAPEEWIPLRSPEWYAENRIDLVLGKAATRIDPAARTLTLADGSTLSYGALILATGAEPIPLQVPGSELPHVHLLRSLADSRAIIAKAKTIKRAIVVGASFIGLEVAASLRAREIEVHVVAPDERPMQRALGPAFGDFLRALHESHGVKFHLGQTLARIEPDAVVLQSGERIAAELVVVGIGVRPLTALAESAGLRTENGVVVDAYLETSAKGVYAAGDIARWPDPHTGKSLRIEHWVVAERQGATAARNALGLREKFDAVPFFWSQHYDVPIAYVGVGQGWDAVEVAGDINGRDCTVTYRSGGRICAVATIYRDTVSLQAEAALERDDHAELEKLAKG